MKSKFKMIVHAFVLVTMSLVAVHAAGKTPMTEVRTSKSYHYLHIEGTLDVQIEQSEEPGVIVEGTRFQVNNTITMLRNDTLFVYQTNIARSNVRTNVLIRVDNLSLLEAKGDVTVDCSGLINTDLLMVKASDGARVRLDVRALKVESKATGCSHIHLTGICGSVVENVDGCGIIDSQFLDVIDQKNPVLLCIEC